MVFALLPILTDSAIDTFSIVCLHIILHLHVIVIFSFLNRSLTPVWLCFLEYVFVCLLVVWSSWCVSPVESLQSDGQRTGVHYGSKVL